MQGLPAEKVSLPRAMQRIPGIQSGTCKGCGGKAEKNRFDSAAMQESTSTDVEGDEKVMPDREKVIRHIKAEIEITKLRKKHFALVDIDMLSDAYELLKEQESEISNISNEYLKLVNVASKQPEIVRCRDCIHYRYYGLSDETVSECRIDHCENPDADWFCADGERREDE